MSVQRKHDIGTGGTCICPKCGEKVPHRDGIPCQEEICPGCKAKMLREGSHHYQLFLEKQAKKQRKTPESAE